MKDIISVLITLIKKKRQSLTYLFLLYEGR